MRKEGRTIMYIPNISNSLSKGVEVVVDGHPGMERVRMTGGLGRHGWVMGITVLNRASHLGSYFLPFPSPTSSHTPRLLESVT